MLEVQKLYDKFFSEDDYGDSLSKLDLFRNELTVLGIDQREYPEHNMFLLDYNQIDAIKNHPVVNECRGLLMGYDGQIIRKGFTRFYNLGENGIDQFDFEHSIAFEKADGSLMFVYFCTPTDRWEIGTRGTAFAEGPNEWHGTFRGFMLNAMGRTEEQFQHDCGFLDRRNTYLFEAVGPDNRIVTPYTTNHLIELSNINNVTGKETFIEILGFTGQYISFFKLNFGWNVRPIKHYSFNTQADCMIALEALTGLEEGYVVYNTQTKMRVKIKNATYLAAHRLRSGGLTLNSICELVVMNEQDEYLAVFPEDTPKFFNAHQEFGLMLEELKLVYDANKMIETQKDFALSIGHVKLSGCMFQARKKGTDPIHEFNQLPVGKRADY